MNLPQRNLCSQQESSSSTVLVNNCMSRLIEEDYKTKCSVCLNFMKERLRLVSSIQSSTPNTSVNYVLIIQDFQQPTTEGFTLCSFIPFLTLFTNIELSCSDASGLFRVRRHSKSRTLFLIEHVPWYNVKFTSSTIRP